MKMSLRYTLSVVINLFALYNKKKNCGRVLTMAYNIIWFYHKRIFLVALTGDVSLDDLSRMLLETAIYVDDGEYPVHVIVDFTRLRSLPVSPGEMTQFLQRFPKQDAQGISVLVTRTRLEYFMFQSIHEILGLTDSYVCQSINDALTTLEQADPTLLGMTRRAL